MREQPKPAQRARRIQPKKKKKKKTRLLVFGSSTG